MENNRSPSGSLNDTIFRSAKRRRLLHPRKHEPDRNINESVDEDAVHLGDGKVSQETKAFDEATIEVAHRRRIPVRRNGINFSAGTPQTSLVPDQPTTLIVSIPRKSSSMNDRFATQTGQVSDSSDKFMTAYIDDRLNGARGSAITQVFTSQQSNDGVKIGDDRYKHKAVHSEPRREPATLGRLQEIDLGPETQALNVARTAVATRRLYDRAIRQNSSPQEYTGNNQRDNPRTTTRRQHQWHRNDQLTRDYLVEAILSETRTEHAYNNEEQGQEDTPTDELMAAQFHAEYLEQAESRNSQAVSRAAKTHDSAAAKNLRLADRDEYAKGPKLGGSRMQRAAMRDKELAARNSSSQRKILGRR